MAKRKRVGEAVYSFRNQKAENGIYPVCVSKEEKYRLKWEELKQRNQPK